MACTVYMNRDQPVSRDAASAKILVARSADNATTAPAKGPSKTTRMVDIVSFAEVN